MNRRWMLYSHDAMGLGHVRRAIAIARSVLDQHPDLASLLVTCSPLVDALPVPGGLDYIKLPSARKVANREYCSRTIRLSTPRFVGLRANLIAEAAREFDPDLLLVDKTPLGLMGELQTALHALRGAARPARVVLGWRDILDTPETMAAEFHATGALDTIRDRYDEVWVYGDPQLFDVRTQYALPDDVASRVRYLGYLCARPDPAESAAARQRLCGDADPLAVVTVGGGEDGERLIATYLDAARRGLLPAGLESVVVAGPCMAPDAVARLGAKAPAHTRVVPFLPDLAPLLAAADVAVAMAGYNTVCELLAASTPAVLVPRTLPRREQAMRTERLVARGLCDAVDPDGLTPRALAEAVRERLRIGTPPPSGLMTSGLEMAAARVGQLLGVDRCPSAPLWRRACLSPGAST